MFNIVDPARRDPSRLAAFEKQAPPPAIGDHEVAAEFFQPDDDLVIAVNAALAVGAPLLLTGEPGTGKTQVAYWLAWYFGLDPRSRLFLLPVRSTTTASDLLYRFDTVAYFHAAHDPRKQEQDIDRSEFVRKGPLWKALISPRSIVLIDEIDKAPRDFPNDLLHSLEQHTFQVPETGAQIRRPEGAPPPLVIITSNSERRLPEPFLRRCIFHHIEFTDELVRRAVAARARDFATLADDAREQAIKRFLELRERELRKKPATAELLVWLTILGARSVTADELRKPLRELPALAALIKDRDDLGQI